MTERTIPSRSMRVLRQHLQTEALLSITAVPCHRRRASVLPVQEAEQGGETLSATTVYDQSVPSAAPRFRKEPRAAAPPVAARPLQARAWQMPLAREPAGPPLSTPERRRVLAELEAEEVRNCTRCELSRARTQTVFGEGNPDARIMFIGEGPGQVEDREGRPFVGPAGELLDRQIAAMGLSREVVYIANVVKCRPPGNRTPLPQEAHACSGYLQRQIEVVRPTVIVTLGGAAVKMILGLEEGITRLRGRWGWYRGIDPAIPVMPTFHPAYLLRAYTVENRKKVWTDLQAVMARLQEGAGRPDGSEGAGDS